MCLTSEMCVFFPFVSEYGLTAAPESSMIRLIHIVNKSKRIVKINQ